MEYTRLKVCTMGTFHLTEMLNMVRMNNETPNMLADTIFQYVVAIGAFKSKFTVAVLTAHVSCLSTSASGFCS